MLITSHIQRLHIRLLCALLCLVSVGCKHFDEPAWEESLPEAANIAIADLHEMISGRTVVVEQNIVIGGYVTSSDAASNFHRTLTIEDSTGGAEIMVGLYDIHNIYPKDYYLTINLNGCAVGEHYGVMQVGLPTAEYSYYPTDYFSSRSIADKHIKRYDKRRTISPLPLSINAQNPLPAGRVSVTGVLQYGKVDGEECFIIKMRDEEDCNSIDYSGNFLGL